MKKYSLFLASLVLLLLASCEKPEKKYVLPPLPAGIQTQIFSLGDNYENQIWFSIANQKTWVNSHECWEIAFGSDAGSNVQLNCGINGDVAATKIEPNKLASITADYLNSLPDSAWHVDNPSGEADSQVFNGWFVRKTLGSDSGRDLVYVIRRGPASMAPQQYLYIQLVSRVGGVYHIKWKYMFNATAQLHDVYIPTNPDYNYTYYNFGSESIVNNEPTTNTEWDIVFTTYRKYIPDPTNGNKPYPYTLRGVLSNHNGVKVYDVPNVGLNTWNQIDLNYAKGIVYSPFYDEIGYDWKIWNMSANKYTMANKIFVVKDVKDNYFKLKFVDFYDDNGKKGYPKMAWELLK